jgi:hypothetical protein
MEDWVQQVCDNADTFSYLEGKNVEMIEREKKEIFLLLGLEDEKYLMSLSLYRYIDEIRELHLGKHIRWLRKGTNRLTNGAFVTQVKFLDKGTYIVCKNAGHMMQYLFDDCYTFQKITAEEWVILLSQKSSCST